MAARDGRSAIKKLIISLLVLSAIVCGAIYMVIGPAPETKREASEPQPRTLAYQEKIARAAEEAKKEAAQTQAAAPQTAVPAESAPAQDSQAAAAPEAGANATPPEQDATDMAALPPDPNALPWEHPAPPGQAEPGMDSEATAPMPPPPGEYGYSEDAMPPPPGAEADPNAWPGGSEDEPQEWVQVLVSGVGMHGTASEDAPMLFAFPYGRVLRVVSRYENWVEVIDPQSAATGWMQAQYLAPVAPPGTQQEVFYEEEPRERRGIFRRIFGGR